MAAQAEALDFNLVDPRNTLDEVFYPRLERLRVHAPVFWSDIQKAWIATSHEAVWAGFHDPRFSAQRQLNQFRSIPEGERAQVIPNLSRYNPDWIVNVDGVKHLRLRKLVVKAFSRHVVEALRPQVEQLVQGVLDEVEGRDEVEFVQDVAFRIPATVITRLLGLPDDYIPELRDWARGMTALSAAPPREDLILADGVMARMNEVFREQIALRRANPGADLLSQLVTARDDKDSLTEDELLGLCHILIIAGHNTTANGIAGGLLAFLRNPDQRQYFLDNPEHGLDCMTEMLRYGGMSTAQVRIVAEDMELDGQSLKAGQPIFLMIAAANRDPAVFEDPARFDSTRRNDQAMTFGPGFHHCLGHLLTRMELEVFFRAFFQRFSRVEVLDEEVAFTPTIIFRGPEKLRVRLGA